MARDIASMRDQAIAALELLTAGSQVRATAQTILGFADYLDGAREVADQRLADAADLATALGANGARISALGGRAVIALDDGRWHDASLFVDDGLQLIGRANLGGYAGAALIHATRARVAVHAGDMSTAKVAVQDAEELRPFLTSWLPSLAIIGREVLTRAYLELDDVLRAASALADLEAVTQHTPGLDHATEAVATLRSLLDAARTRASSDSRLTPAELRLLPWLATELSFRQIAERLFVSVHTVKAQVTSIYRKLGVTSRSQAVAESRTRGLLHD